MENQTVNEGKTTAIISYITIIGTVLAWVMNNSKKNPFSSFHIRQMIGLNILYFVNQFVIYKYAGLMAGGIVGFVIFILWIIGFIGTVQGQEKKVPLLGDQFQEWFKGI